MQAALRSIPFISLLIIFSYLNDSFGMQSRTGDTHRSKPGWFWNQPADCGMTALGLERHSQLYPENAKEAAHENSIHNYLRQKMTEHSGGQVFNITERGAAYMGGDQAEHYDTTGIQQIKEELVKLDYQIAGNMAMVLVGPESCRESVDQLTHSIQVRQAPAWVQNLPDNDAFIYAVGVSEGYFYQISSWKQAESAARRNLSASLQSRVRGLQDQEIGISMEILYADLAVTLHNTPVIARYHDPQTDLHYVLIRMKL